MKVCNGKCVFKSVTCDGEEEQIEGQVLEEDDATDDEYEASLFTTNACCTTLWSGYPCLVEEGKHLCQDGRWCIDEDQLCDGIVNCRDKSDEGIACECPLMYNCLTCRNKNDFKCKHGKYCVKAAQVCDGLEDCQDKSDEANCKCPGMDNECENCNTNFYQPFKCNNGEKCIADAQVCDGNADCEDGSDEACTDDEHDHCHSGMKTCNGKFVCNYKSCNGKCREHIGEHICGSSCLEANLPCNGSCTNNVNGIKELCNGKCQYIKSIFLKTQRVSKLCLKTLRQ